MSSDAMNKCYMLSSVGKDQPGIVAKLSAGLCKNGCNLGDSSMARLGGNFTIMVMVEFSGELSALQERVKSICDPLGLSSHLVEIEEEPQYHLEPDVRISIYAEDRLGIVEDVTVALADAGLNILHLESNVDSGADASTYYIHLEGTVSKGIEPLYRVLETLEAKNIKSQLIPINAQAM